MATVKFPFEQGDTVKLTKAIGEWTVGTQAYLKGYEFVVDSVDLHAIVRVEDSVHGNTDLRVTVASIAAL